MAKPSWINYGNEQVADYQFTENAERDLENIIDYTVHQWGEEQAHTYLDGLENHGQLLADNPDLGVKRENIAEGLLSFPYESHVLYYVKQPHGITILRLLHGHMDPAKHL